MTDFIDTLPPDTALVHTPALEPALLKDVSRTFELLGVQACRASVVNIQSMAVEAQWSISNSGGFIDSEHEATPLEQFFPGAKATLSRLAAADNDKTLTQKLGPQLWRFAWRTLGERAVVAEAYFLERRDSVIDMDIALLRLVCGIGVRTVQSAANGDAPLASGAEKAAPERRVNARLPPAASAPTLAPALAETSKAESEPVPVPQGRINVTSAGLGVLLCTVLLTGWLAAIGYPTERELAASQKLQLARMQAMAQETMVLELSNAMASGDYGQVQSVLSSFGSLGYFTSAAVANPRQRVIALAGRAEQLRIGDPLPADALPLGMRSKLRLGSQEHGILLVVPVQPQGELPIESDAVELASWAAFATSAMAAAVLAWRMRRKRSQPRF